MATFREANYAASSRLIRAYVPYAGPFERLPHGPHKLDAARNQRLRILQSYAELLREPPPAGSITVATICAKAGVGRRQFYELFPGGRPECFRRLLLLALRLRRKHCDRWAQR